jgi:hypothetical protein
MKKTLLRIHFNKPKQCWSVHHKGVCHMIKHLMINVPVESQEKPNKKSNPRFFFICKGNLTIKSDGTGIIE